MLDRLKERLEARKAAVTQRATQDAARVTRMQRVVEQAGIMESLLEDPRYHDYRQMLDEARVALVDQLVNARPEGDVSAFAHEVAVLQGRIYQLDAILKTPETILHLAEEADTANGASRQSAPLGTSVRHATSAR